MTSDERTVYRAMLGSDGSEELPERLTRIHEATLQAMSVVGKGKLSRDMMALVVGIVTGVKVGRPKGT